MEKLGETTPFPIGDIGVYDLEQVGTICSELVSLVPEYLAECSDAVHRGEDAEDVRMAWQERLGIVWTNNLSLWVSGYENGGFLGLTDATTSDVPAAAYVRALHDEEPDFFAVCSVVNAYVVDATRKCYSPDVYDMSPEERLLLRKESVAAGWLCDLYMTAFSRRLDVMPGANPEEIREQLYR